MQFFRNMGTTELLIIGIVLLLLFGGQKLSEFARGLGEGGKELKNAKKEFDEALNETKTDLEKATKSKKGGAK